MDQKLIRPAGIRLTAAFLAVFAALSCIFAFFEGRLYYQRRENYLYLAENQVRLIEGSLDIVMARAYTLRSLVQTHHGSTDFFDEFMPQIYEETTEETGLQVKNFILAPNAVVENIYPLEGNEQLLGMDYMDQSLAGNEEAVEAYRENKLVLTEPFALKQGGIGIAGRLPVYLMEDGEKTFWGMVSVTLDMDYLMEQFNLEYLENSGISYCLQYTNDAGEAVVLASSEKLPSDPISCGMTSNNLEWTLEVAPKDGWTPLPELCAGFLVILLLSLAALRALISRSKLQKMNAILEELAIRDNLTGCYSRHYVNAMLLLPGGKEWKDSNACYSLAVVDVDSFKQINDKYGHDMGDKALVAIARTLQGLCDDLRGDCVIRYGGDEFIFLMNHVDRGMFEERLTGIVQQVRAIRFEEAPEMRLTVSVGAVMGNQKQSYYELFSRADEMVYASKEAGKDQYRLA